MHPPHVHSNLLSLTPHPKTRRTISSVTITAPGSKNGDTSAACAQFINNTVLCSRPKNSSAVGTGIRPTCFNVSKSLFPLTITSGRPTTEQAITRSSPGSRLMGGMVSGNTATSLNATYLFDQRRGFVLGEGSAGAYFFGDGAQFS